MNKNDKRKFLVKAAVEAVEAKTALMEAAERPLATRSRKACICVGLFEAYGPAQRLYARRGYVPDGRGVCEGHRPLRPGERVEIGHHLLLWLLKDLEP